MDSCLERLRQAIASATSDMSSEELTRQPEGKWSAAEVLEHLYLTYTGTQKAFRALPESRETAGRRSHFQTKSGGRRSHPVRLFSQGTEVSRSGSSPGHAAGKDRCRHRSPDRRHGQDHRAMRRALWLARESPGPSCPGSSDCEAMAEISPGPRKAPRETDSRAEKTWGSPSRLKKPPA